MTLVGGSIGSSWPRMGYIKRVMYHATVVVIVEYDNGGTQTLQLRRDDDWSGMVGHRVEVTEFGAGDYATYRIRTIAVGVDAGR